MKTSPIKSRKTRGKSKVNRLADVFRVTTKMTYKNIKQNCVVRGMKFEDVVDGTVPGLSNWLHAHAHAEVKPHLLNDFDEWIENILKERGAHDLIHPQLRLGYIGEVDEETGKTKVKKVKGIKKKRRKREKTSDGIFQGTKKALTFQCQKEGKSIEETIETVMKNFPEAAEKSIKIWYKKCKRLNA